MNNIYFVIKVVDVGVPVAPGRKEREEEEKGQRG